MKESVELGRSQVTAHHVQGVVPGGGGGPAHGGEVGGQEVPGPGVLLHHSSEHRPPPGPPGGEGHVPAVPGGAPAAPRQPAETGGAETFLEVVGEEGVQHGVDGCNVSHVVTWSRGHVVTWSGGHLPLGCQLT